MTPIRPWKKTSAPRKMSVAESAAAAPAVPSDGGPPIPNILKMHIWLNTAIADAELHIVQRRGVVHLKAFYLSKRIEPSARLGLFGLVERLRWVIYELGRVEGEDGQPRPNAPHQASCLSEAITAGSLRGDSQVFNKLRGGICRRALTLL